MKEELSDRYKGIHGEWDRDTLIIIKVIQSGVLKKSEVLNLKNIHINNMLGYRGGELSYLNGLEKKVECTIKKVYKK